MSPLTLVTLPADDTSNQRLALQQIHMYAQPVRLIHVVSIQKGDKLTAGSL